MYDDVESNFWKEHFSHLQHKNMVRTNAERLSFSQVLDVIKKFNDENSIYNPGFEDSGSYITWEVFISDTIKLRLFFQSQIKGSLLQKQGNDFVKIADAKFPYNPFPEIKEFLERKDFYIKELAKEKKDSVESNMKIKISGEFIKAYLENKFSGVENLRWNLIAVENGFLLKISKSGTEKEIPVSFDNFVEDINVLQLYA